MFLIELYIEGIQVAAEEERQKEEKHKQCKVKVIPFHKW